MLTIPQILVNKVVKIDLTNGRKLLYRLCEIGETSARFWNGKRYLTISLSKIALISGI